MPSKKLSRSSTKPKRGGLGQRVRAHVTKGRADARGSQRRRSAAEALAWYRRKVRGVPGNPALQISRITKAAARAR